MADMRGKRAAIPTEPDDIDAYQGADLAPNHQHQGGSERRGSGGRRSGLGPSSGATSLSALKPNQQSTNGRRPSARTPQTFVVNATDDDEEDDQEGDGALGTIGVEEEDDEFEYEWKTFMIPLSSTLGGVNEETEMPHSISLFTGVGLIIGMSIGSGIFASPGPVLARTGSSWAALSVWIFGGFLVLLGSSCYAELGACIPGNGGEFIYLLKSFGELPAFLYSWSQITVGRPATVAVIASVFGEYLAGLILGWGSNSSAATGGGPVPGAQLLSRVVSIVLIWALTAIHSVSSALGAKVQDVFTFLKLGSLLLIGFEGIKYLIVEEGGGKNFEWGAVSKSSTNPGDYAIALYSALWAYDGWNNLNLVTGELKDSRRNLPRAVIIGPSIVIFCYLLVNVAYYAVLPVDVVTHSNTVALDFGRLVFGPIASVIVPLIVLGSTFGAANASIFTGARVASTSARHGHAPAWLGTLSKSNRTPINALIVQATLSSLFCLSASFSPLVTFYSNIAWGFYLLTVLGLLVLRWREPDLERPHRVWIISAVSFCIVVAGMIVLSVVERPVEALYAAAFVVCGVPVWWLSFKSDVPQRVSDSWARFSNHMYDYTSGFRIPRFTPVPSSDNNDVPNTTGNSLKSAWKGLKRGVVKLAAGNGRFSRFRDETEDEEEEEGTVMRMSQFDREGSGGL
ncbi:hypothetical protein HDV05_000768 [Chytridiales sp. JEL 0842]|nr:hypothetical protein HDV05_000768 [Chytridiales sp. JEL 0842]